LEILQQALNNNLQMQQAQQSFGSKSEAEINKVRNSQQAGTDVAAGRVAS